MRRVRALLLLLLACGFPESKNPLVPPEKGVLDKDLIGTWVQSDTREKNTFVITQREGAVLAISSPKKGDSASFEGHACVIEGEKFLNVRLMEKGEVASNWLILKYELAKDGTLSVQSMKDAAVRKAFDSGALKGEVKGDPAQVLITDTVEKLTGFIKGTKALYEPFGTFKRK